MFEEQNLNYLYQFNLVYMYFLILPITSQNI